MFEPDWPRFLKVSGIVLIAWGLILAILQIYDYPDLGNYSERVYVVAGVFIVIGIVNSYLGWRKKKKK
jgi:hypothetical protein